MNPLELARQKRKAMAEQGVWVEILGRTECEIYKHELKESAYRMLGRIDDAFAKHKASMGEK